MTGMMVDGIFDAYPNLRVGFLEGGTAWIPRVIDRLERVDLREEDKSAILGGNARRLYKADI